MSHVRCYADTSYPERPTAFEWGERWLEVTEVLWQARTPEGMRFVVLADDHRHYRLDWTEALDAWSVTRQP